jgi:hypothetical protein
MQIRCTCATCGGFSPTTDVVEAIIEALEDERP